MTLLMSCTSPTVLYHSNISRLLPTSRNMIKKGSPLPRVHQRIRHYTRALHFLQNLFRDPNTIVLTLLFPELGADSREQRVSPMSTRFQRSATDDLEDSITCHREALALRPHGHPAWSSSLVDLANAMTTHFKQSGKIRIWRRQSDATVKQLLSFLKAIQIAQLLSVTSVLPCSFIMNSREK